MAIFCFIYNEKPVRPIQLIEIKLLQTRLAPRFLEPSERMTTHVSLEFIICIPASLR
ncbi:hypothetical protein CFII64_17556 [Pseudomonas sp. CFII64]|nr:hypothetical protein CFII64_17556 [Pseudomonas sp. CFII64]